MSSKDPVLDVLAPPMARPPVALITVFEGNAVLSQRLKLIDDETSRQRRYTGDMEYGDWHV